MEEDAEATVTDRRIIVEPFMSDGRLAWAVRSADRREVAVVDEGGYIVVDEGGYVHAGAPMTKPFEAVVRALGEWYAADRASYGGANAGKVKRALTRGG